MGRVGLAAGRDGNFKFLADAFGGEFFDFPVTRNGRRYAPEIGYGRWEIGEVIRCEDLKRKDAFN